MGAALHIRDVVRRALEIECEGLQRLLERIGPAEEEAVGLIAAARGRVITTGMGKAGLIARKLAATLASTGTPAHFLHPTEAVHGDLGIVTPEDIVIAISNSGETREVVGILPYLRYAGVKVIALTGRTDSTLARQSDVVVDVGVAREADPLGIAPSASTTAALAMGDALAAAVMELKRFTRDQYARLHPGGSIGLALLARVRDLMTGGALAPSVDGRVSVREAICEMTSKRLGATFVVDEQGRLVGILTDGDLRRLFQARANPLEMRLDEVMTRAPKSIGPEAPAVEALRRMEDHAITVLPVVDEERRIVGAIHLHDLVKAGLALWSSAQE